MAYLGGIFFANMGVGVVRIIFNYTHEIMIFEIFTIGTTIITVSYLF